jgi:hypothetical protein
VIAAVAGIAQNARASVTPDTLERTILVCRFVFMVSPCMADRGV